MSAMRSLRGLVGVVLVCVTGQLFGADKPLGQGDFEAQAIGTLPTGWSWFPRRAVASASIISPGAFGSDRCLKLEAPPKPVRGMLRMPLDKRSERLLIRLSFAVPSSRDNTFVVQTSAPGDTTASQLRLAVRGGKLMHYDGRSRRWKTVTDRIETTVDSSNPRWHHVEILAGRKRPTIDFWVSEPGSRRLPIKPTASLPACRTGRLFGSVDLLCGHLSRGSGFLIDNFAVQRDAEIPPVYFRRLAEAGGVEIVFHDPKEFARIGTGGLAKFHYRVVTNFRFKYSFKRQDGTLHVAVSPTVTNVRITLRHTVSVPESYDNENIWQKRLVKHEFDHVAISTDPRAFMLVEHLIRKTGRIERAFDNKQQPGNLLYRKVVNEEFDKRRDAVTALLRANYRLLDDVSKHGSQRIQDRESFFHRLFTKENLDAMQFPYLGDVLDLLKSKEYQAVPLYYNYDHIL